MKHSSKLFLVGLGVVFCASWSLLAQNAGPAVVAHTTAAGAVAGPKGVYTWNTGNPVDAEQMLNQVEEATREAMDNVDVTTRKAYDEAVQNLRTLTKKSASNNARLDNLSRLTSLLHTGSEAPAIVLTSPMEPKQRAELQEDLRVMDQLLRDETKQVDGDASHQALGITLWMSDRAAFTPMYLESYGAVFSAEVNFPLTGPSKEPAAEEKQPAGSAWERARRELQSSSRTNLQQHYGAVTRGGGGYGGGYGPGYAIRDHRFHTGPGIPYDPARVEALEDALFKALGEAKNIRHLKPGDAVTITVSGTDDSGTPTRLTIKASKADIDKLADGKLTPEQFRKIVTRNLG